MNDDWETDAALAVVRQGRETLLAAADCPPSRHLAFAAIMGGYVAAPALPLAARLVAGAMLMVCVALVVRWDKRRTGLFISGYRAGRTRWVLAAMIAVILPLNVAGSVLADRHGLRWPALAMALPVTGFAYAMSCVWMRVFRREMLGAR